MDKILVIVDMQNDFIDGTLKSPEAHRVCDNIVKKIGDWDGDTIIYTQDTHLQELYQSTEEGKNIPSHCIYNTWGWELHEFIHQALIEYMFAKESNKVIPVEKDAFGSTYELPVQIEALCLKNPFEIHIVGLCTDICVISNALILHSGFPYAKIIVDASCCAGSTKERHMAALEVMKANCIDITNEK